MKLKDGREIHIGLAQKEHAKDMIEYMNIVGGESDHLLSGANEFNISIEDEENWIESINSSESSILLIAKDKEKIVGIASLISPTKDRIAHQSEVGISLRKDYWGLGIGTAMMEDLIQFARENNQTEIIHLGVKADNAPAIALYKKLGFVEIGRYPKFFKIKGEYFDEILMNLDL